MCVCVCVHASSPQGFFEEAPPPLSDVSFTDMNLSRPLLKVIGIITCHLLTLTVVCVCVCVCVCWFHAGCAWY